MLKEFFRSLVYIVYRVLPKFNYAVIFGSPDYEGSALALQEKLNETSLRRVIFFICGNVSDQFQLKPKTKVVRKDSVQGALYFLFARYVFFTHECFMRRFPPNVVSVNVWHGMPIKKIGWLSEGDKGIAAHYTIVTSEFWTDIMQKAMIAFDGTLITGLPRNDQLLSNPASVRSRLKFLRGNAFKKKIVWLPTYRKSVFTQVPEHGRDSGNVFGMPGITAEALNDLFKRHDAFAIVKPHPWSRLKQSIELSNLAVVDDQWLRDRGLTLYELLGQMDVLVTDISSVVVDYLILDRPVIHSFPDLAEYESSKGFTINPVTDYLVGPMAVNAEELFDCLSRVLQGEDAHAAQRKRMRQLFHKYTDGDSTNRLLKHLKLLPK